MDLSEHFTMEEFTASDWGERHGVDNQPGDSEIVANLQELALEMERVRTILGGHPIFVHSAYRSPKVNAGVGGVATSAHLRGLACDFTCPSFGSPYEVAKAIEASGLKLDQLLREFGWVHAGFPEEGKPFRQQYLTKRSADSPYEVGILA